MFEEPDSNIEMVWGARVDFFSCSFESSFEVDSFFNVEMKIVRTEER